MPDVLNDAFEIAGYGAIGLVLMAAGYAVVDALTPGRLFTLIVEQRNRNAALITSASVGAMAIVAAMAVHSAEGDASTGLTAAAVYGVVGLVLMVAHTLSDGWEGVVRVIAVRRAMKGEGRVYENENG